MVNPYIVMQEAVQLALMGKGYTLTNPIVGAVVVKNDRIIGRGYHTGFGMPHAEIEALKSCEESPEGADLYVTLEPCSTYGKTPPCTDAIIKAGIKRVFIGVADPNPINSGKGIDLLLKNGVEVFLGFDEELCAEIIEDFTKYIYTKKPYVTLKAATSIDGKIATKTGDSKWITNESSRIYVHYLRSISDAILVGIGTILADNPHLNVRSFSRDKEPFKVVLDTHLKIPEDASVIKEWGKNLIVATSTENKEKVDALLRHGVKIILCGKKDGLIDLKELTDKLVQLNILNIFVEGGSRVFASFLKEHLTDKIYIFTSNKIIGGDGVPLFGSLGVTNIADCITCRHIDTKRFEEDMLNVYKLTDYKKYVIELTQQHKNRCASRCSQG